MLSCTILIFRVKWEKQKVNSGDKEKVSDHIPLAFIYFVYQKKNEWTTQKSIYSYICQRCYYYRKSGFSEAQTD